MRSFRLSASANGAQNFRDECERERTQNLLRVSLNLRSFLRSKWCNFLGSLYMKFKYLITSFPDIYSILILFRLWVYSRYMKWPPEKMHNLMLTNCEKNFWKWAQNWAALIPYWARVRAQDFWNIECERERCSKFPIEHWVRAQANLLSALKLWRPLKDHKRPWNCKKTQKQ